MAQFILINTVNIPPTGPVYAGTVLDDRYDSSLITSIPGAGGELADLPNTLLEAAGEKARAAKAAGHAEQCDDIMLAAKASEPVSTAALADDSVTAAKIAAGAVGTSEIADGSVAPVDVTTGHMRSTAYPSTTNGAQTLLPAVAFDRAVTIVVKTTQTFADNAGVQPTFQVGQTGTPNKFAPTSEFTNDVAAPGGVTYSGVLSSGTALLVTAVAATVDGAGAITVTAAAERN